MRKTSKLAFVLTAALLLIVVTACGNNAGKETASGGQTTVNIATGGSAKPFTFVNDTNKIDGYDIQIVKAIFEGLPQYKANIETTEFSSIFAGLDTDRYQIGANNLGSNKERKEKYIYSDPIFENQFVIAVKAGRTDIKTFSDLEGKTTEVNPGVNYTIALENYNKDSAKKPVVLKYTEAELAAQLQHVEDGVIDFSILDGPMLQLYIKEYHLKLTGIPLSQEDSDRIGVPYSYLILSKGKNSEQLVKDVNQRIKELITDGTISKISQQYLDGDFAPKIQ
ncbi:transporter substrate-binding domain-containing protein [Paenibacillus sp. GCM10012307]|uniref:Transporter substrate-binding domain-containing protein n=1 Tax=Paenibacillus roseus TaxID=2798579 RepID=A0A934MRG5_9BACL|nr:transporter substrate-binding domain-containing protein [Paenibacillus roseus]MBJ6362873.1 transporter substrate-binding domain-containing protein [Paenibacillus roseus]